MCVFIAGVFIRWGTDFDVADRFAILAISVCLTIFIYVKNEIN
jgi:hypothetical protein